MKAMQVIEQSYSVPKTLTFNTKMKDAKTGKHKFTNDKGIPYTDYSRHTKAEQ